MAKVKKRTDGRYQMSVYVGILDGKRKYKVVYGRTQKEVQAKADELRVKLGKGIDINAASDTFSVWADRWTAMKRAETSAAQVDLYTARLKIVREYIGKLKLSEISTADIQSVITELAQMNPHTGKPTAKNTLRAYSQIVASVFDYAIQNRVIDYNPAHYVKTPQKAPQAKRRALSPEEREWVATTKHRAQTAAMIMLYAGLRRGEVAALTWSDIDINEGTIRVNKAVTYKSDETYETKAPKTEAGDRTVNIPKVLRDYLSVMPRESLLVVTTAKGKPMTESAWKRLHESYMATLNEAHGLVRGSRFSPKGLPMTIKPFGWHELRHTFCTMLYEAGVDPLDAQRQMGHSDIKTTLGIYTHLSRERGSLTATKLDAYLGNTSQMLVSDENVPLSNAD